MDKLSVSLFWFFKVMTGFIHCPTKVQLGRFVASFVLLVFVAWLAACGPLVDRAPTSNKFVSYVSQQTPGNDLIAVGDTIAVIVKGEDDITGNYKVDAEGNVTLPLISKLQLRGLDPARAAKAVTDAYAKGYLVAPDVRVEKRLAEAVFVMGAVRVPGSYAWCQDMTVMKAASLAGGFNTDSDFRYFDVVRQGHVLSSDVSTLAQPGDVIIVKSGAQP